MAVKIALYRLSDLSLDAPVVGCLWLGLFSSVYHFTIDPQVYALMFICISCVYIWDRLKQSSGELHQARHRFHLKHRKRFIAALIIAVAIIIAILLIFPLSRSYYQSGLIIFIPILVYLRLTPQLSYIPHAKHALASLLFVAGTTFPVWGVHLKADFQLSLELSSLCIIAYLNMLQIDDREISDAYRISGSFIYLILIIMLACAFWLSSWILCVAALSILLLRLLAYFTHHIDERNYRTLADIALMIPAGIAIIFLTLL